MTTRELVFEYTTKGARAAERADENVRESVRQTGRAANRQSNQVERWATKNRNAIKKIGLATSAAVGGVLAASPTLRAQLGGIRSAFTLFSEQIVRDVIPGANSLGQIAVDLAMWFRDLNPTIRRIIGTITVLVGVLGPVVAIGLKVASAVATVAGVLAGLNPVVLGIIAVVGTMIGAWMLFEDEIRSVVNVAIGLVSDLFGWFRDIGSWLKDGVSDAWDWFTDAGQGAKDFATSIWGILTDIGSWLTDRISGAWDWLKSTGADTRDFIGGLWDTLTDIGSWVVDRISGAFNWFTDALSRPMDALDDLWDVLTDIGDWVKNGVSGAFDWLVDAWNATLGGRSLELPSFTISIPDWVPEVGGRSAEIGGQSATIPKLATGGTVTQGGFAFLHAGNEVSPAAQVDRGGTERSGGITVDNIEINIMGSGNARRDGRNAAQEVAQEFQRELGGRGVNR